MTWPRSLATRTALVLLVGLALVQVGGLTIHALDRLDLQRLAQSRDLAVRAMNLYSRVAVAPPEERAGIVADFALAPDIDALLGPAPPAEVLPRAVPALERQLNSEMLLVPLPPARRPQATMLLGGFEHDRLIFGLQLPGGDWLSIVAHIPPPRPWHSTNFLLAFILMSGAAGLLTVWAVRRLTAPVTTLAAAAEALGRDVNAPPLSERGPSELAAAAGAFNTMADRIRRFVDDRTFLLTAIGHDLRTPITRLRLRAEFMEDDEQRRRMVADLDDLEAMVSATLAFGRDATLAEPATVVDLVALIDTVLDEATDARPDLPAAAVRLIGPRALAIEARPVALKRALTNLVGNALTYGGSAHVEVLPPAERMVTVRIDDDGAGLPPEEIEKVFLPFHRVETSRNRETGGVGLGLSIARNILRAHGGDVVLANRSGGGLRATVTLPL